MKSVLRPLVALLVTLTMTACVTVQSTRLGSAVIRPPVPANAVAIYRSAAQVGAQYEEVALLDAAGDYNYTNEEKMYEKMRVKAGALGANAIVLDSITEPTTGAKVARFLIGTPAERKGKAIAIYVSNTAAVAAR
jgi:hypothetical protein